MLLLINVKRSIIKINHRRKLLKTRNIHKFVIIYYCSYLKIITTKLL